MAPSGGIFYAWIIVAGIAFGFGIALLFVCTVCMTVWDGICGSVDRYFERRVARRGYRLPPPGQ